MRIQKYLGKGAKIMGLLSMARHAQSMYTERQLHTISMTDESARLYNGIKQHDHWTLRNGKSGSIVNLLKKNEDHDEWSFETAFKLPSLKYPEFAGIYFWYTDEQVKHGGFKGANGQFSGVMAGLEFMGKSVDIVVSINHGEMDYTGLRSEDTELKDSPDPAIFKGHDELMLKVISTSKNFKVEIYDKDQKLIYDRVRYTSMTEIGTRLSGKFFGITTDYSDLKTDSAFQLKSLGLFEREETEHYSPEEYHTEVPDISPRLHHEVTHPDEEIQHTISGIEHLTKYLRVVLGEPQIKPIADNVVYMKKTMNFQSAHILELRDALKSVVSVGKKHAMDEEIHRQEVHYLLKDIHSRLTKTGKVLHEAEDVRSSGKLPVLGLLFVGASLFGAGVCVGMRIKPQKKISIH